MKSLKLPLFIAVVSELIIATFVIWFYTRTGTSGLFRWNPKYDNQFHALELMLLVPPLFFLLTLIFYLVTKKQPVVTFIFSCICVVLSLGCAGFCIGKAISTVKAGHYVPKNHAVVKNMLPKENVPLLKHIAVSSDPHWNADYSTPEDRVAIMQQVNSRKYDAFFMLGDITDEGDVPNSYETVVKDINTYLPDTPVRCVMGNHDSLVDACWIFQTYFNGKANAPLYYRMDSGNVHFLILNLLWGTEDFTGAQRKWLISQLEDIPQADTVVVMSHCFYVSNGYVDKESKKPWYDIPSMVDKLCPIFEKYHVDLVLSGHNHLMNVLKKNGITYAICGAMGGPLDKETDYVSPYSVWEENTKHGWIDITFTGADIQLIYYDRDGNELYRCSVENQH